MATRLTIPAEEADPVRHVPAGVEVVEVGITGRRCYTIGTKFGRLTLPTGTWLVYDEDGTPRPYSPAEFELAFTSDGPVRRGQSLLRRLINLFKE